MNCKRGYKQVRQLSHEEMKEYGEFFRLMRESIELSLVKMAPEIGVCRTTISLWEKGKRIPQRDIQLLETKYREVVKKYRAIAVESTKNVTQAKGGISMEIKITKEQYELIRSALERYYYACKDDFETYHKLDSINELETSLIKQAKN